MAWSKHLGNGIWNLIDLYMSMNTKGVIQIIVSILRGCIMIATLFYVYMLMICFYLGLTWITLRGWNASYHIQLLWRIWGKQKKSLVCKFVEIGRSKNWHYLRMIILRRCYDVSLWRMLKLSVQLYVVIWSWLRRYVQKYKKRITRYPRYLMFQL